MKIKIVIKSTKIIISARAIILFLLLLGGIGYLIWRYTLPKDIFVLKKPNSVSVSKINSDAVTPIVGSEMEKLKEEYKNKFVLIFFYDGYSSQAQALAQIQVLKATLNIIEPFKSMSDTVSIKIFTTDSQKCRVKDSGGVRLLICDKKLTDSFKQLGIDHFKLVILSPLQFSSTALLSRGSNSWITISTFNSNLPQDKYNRFLGLQFAQNLGTSMGLAQEGSSLNKASVGLENEPNCAKDLPTAKNWWGGYTSVFKEVGYQKGCNGSSSLIFPEKDTLMSENPKKEGYGRVSEDYLRQVLTCFYKGGERVETPKTATYSATLSSCSLFKNKFPLFWKQ